MNRRQFLGTLAAAGSTGALTGCLGSFGDANPNVTLSEPDRDYSSEDLPYPGWGQQIPAVTLPAPLSGTSVSVRDVETPSVFTFFFSHCQTVCPVLISALRNVQTHAIENDYAEDVRFLPVTFDPERDDADRLRTYAEKMNIDLSADNWQFLRPESKAAAKSAITEQFGVRFERSGEMNGKYMFAHTSLVLLVNADGYVERAYRGSSPDQNQIIEDLKQIR